MQLSRQQQIIALSPFSIYGIQYISSYKKILKIQRVNPEENALQTYRQTDGEMNRTDFIGPLPVVGGSVMFFENLRIKLGHNQYKKKEYNQHSSVFKEFTNNDPNEIR